MECPTLSICSYCSKNDSNPDFALSSLPICRFYRQSLVKMLRIFGGSVHRVAKKKQATPKGVACFFGDPSGTRTPGPLIKSQMLYQLS